ncbi:hypothetical protein O181_074737 [Austropuccinia psidii MF-1]|uniref:Uncharacterized protein n=1 Tax=Austropuccinia psidii MF-1 TaxID=1389203 RepID=A0A9Q3FDL6_9BASI|nr:hypothetical protein [Austropuccinia psidii MF-1]
MVNWPYPAFIGIIGQFSNSPTPRPLSLSLGLGVFSVFQGPIAPGPTPYNMGRSFRPPMASMAHCLWSLGPLGPFWNKCNEAKGAAHQPPRPGGSQNHNWAHLSRFWPQTPTNPEMAKKT